MKIKQLGEKVRKMLANYTIPELNAIVIEGESGVGKTSIIFHEAIQSMIALVKNETAFKNMGLNEIEAEARSRVFFIPLGTIDEVVGLHGMTAVVNGKLETLFPEKFKGLWSRPEVPKVLILDEVNRCTDIKLMNSVQVFLDCGDRRRIGIRNCAVFGSQNPAGDVNYSGTEESDKAFDYRIIKYVLSLDKNDYEYVGDLRGWHNSVIDAATFLYEDSTDSNDAKFKNAFIPPRLLEQASCMINQGFSDLEDLQAACKEYTSLAGYISRSLRGELFKTMSLEELEKTNFGKDNVGVACIIASIRGIISVAKKTGDYNTVKRIGKIMERKEFPASLMAAVHRRFGNMETARHWATPELTKKLDDVKKGIV